MGPKKRRNLGKKKITAEEPSSLASGEEIFESEESSVPAAPSSPASCTYYTPTKSPARSPAKSHARSPARSPAKSSVKSSAKSSFCKVSDVDMDDSNRDPDFDVDKEKRDTQDRPVRQPKLEILAG